MIRSHIAGKPHETDVSAAELFYATAGIDITQISIDKNLKHHAWVVRRTAFSGILTVKFFKVYPVSYTHLDVYKRQVQGTVRQTGRCSVDEWF